jgi:Bacteriophage tail sheath protein
MPSYLHPGVYIEEISSGSKPIEGVSTSVTAFVGVANRGPIGEPVLIGKLDDYMSEFGQITSESDDMGLAVMAFYLNGGKAAYVCRIAAAAGQATASVDLDGQQVDTTAVSPIMTVSASSAGAWANNLFVRITNTDVASRTFDLEVGTRASDGTFQADETLADLSMDPTSDSYVELRVASESSLVSVSVTDLIPNDSGPDNTATDGVSLSAGTVGAAAAPAALDYTSFYSNTLRKFRDVSIIVLPGQQWSTNATGNAFVSATLAHCESTKSRVVIIDPPQNHELTSAAIVSAMALPTSTYSSLYYPWVLMANPLFNVDTNPLANKTVAISPAAIAAGMWAKIDGKRGVWKAPAGVEARVTGAAGLQFDVEDLEQDQLNPNGVNCIRRLPSYGSVIWGSRTLATRADPEWRYVPVRRTAILIEQSIFNGIQWAVFEPNDHPLWGALRANIGSFMNGLFRAGAFQGGTANDAYFVRCGLGDTMTQGDIDRGQVIVIVGFAPLKPAEFVIVRIQQKVGQQ